MPDFFIRRQDIYFSRFEERTGMVSAKGRRGSDEKQRGLSLGVRAVEKGISCLLTATIQNE